ncbi:hypothetical protein DL766_010604 [Monosporascus sp. MC13-8B]|uniref:Uncharacterized protein n=1 Tax=Monosporascus cannonballus TaxID=155416 RepID=A0ABY0H2T0_9PEZI|nr:hypothetical protein DL762_006145 [Monosporascus cannonballus]RYO90952.1 hypothetical protein DL763_005123 [Monosporascus cannonballus]RYP01963.1 hypothetical protein DL766_010604 [Monosporascus sp. MC13-8B]
MFPTLVRRLAGKPAAPSIRNTRTPLAGDLSSRYKPKKVWPPDFSQLTEKEKFRFERRYKRRVKLATARPRWDKLVRLAQLSSVTFVLVYSVLFMDWETEEQPFQGIRDKFRGALGSSGQDQRSGRQNPNIPAATGQR